MTKMMYILVTSLSPLPLPGLLMKNSDAIPADIEKLHKDDIAATIARDVDALTALWDDDAVLLQPGIPPIVGKAAFFDFVKHALAKSPTVKVVKYVPDIRDIQVAGNVAYEWGYFDTAQKSSEQQAPESLRAKLFRVMRRQPDGSWKFTRVMWLPD
jgi:ketosteroid isomerase-like protein